jgi:hypothetical protein
VSRANTILPPGMSRNRHLRYEDEAKSATTVRRTRLPIGAVTLNVQLPHRQIEGRARKISTGKDISMISDAIVGRAWHVVPRAARPGTLASLNHDTMFNQSGRLGT